MGVMAQAVDARRRRELAALRLAPYGLLGVSLLLCAVTVSDATNLIVSFALGTIATLWMSAFVIVMPLERLERPKVGAVYFTVLWLLIATMVVVQPLFGFFAITGYFHDQLALHGRWRFFGVFMTALAVGTAQVGLPDGSAGSISTYGIVLLINILVSGGITWFAAVNEVEDHRRLGLIDELTRVNRRLEDSLRENAELHRRLVAQAREAGVRDERQRMAREIHDTLAQGLTGIITQLGAANAAGVESRHLDAAAQLARESLSEARRSVQALRPAPLESARLPDALAEVADRWSVRNGVEATVTTTGAARPLPTELEAGLLRTAQEALANVAKHADARRVGVTLSYMDDLVTLDVRDDGVGFDCAERPGRASFGLTAMRQRIEGLAGSLEIESEPGAGTAISASVPAVAGAL